MPPRDQGLDRAECSNHKTLRSKRWLSGEVLPNKMDPLQIVATRLSKQQPLHNDDHDEVDDVTDVDSCLDDEGDDDDKNQWVCSRRPVLVCMVILPQG